MPNEYECCICGNTKNHFKDIDYVHVNSFTVTSLQNLLANCGFEIVKINENNHRSTFLPSYITCLARLSSNRNLLKREKVEDLISKRIMAQKQVAKYTVEKPKIYDRLTRFTLYNTGRLKMLIHL